MGTCQPGVRYKQQMGRPGDLTAKASILAAPTNSGTLSVQYGSHIEFGILVRAVPLAGSFLHPPQFWSPLEVVLQ